MAVLVLLILGLMSPACETDREQEIKRDLGDDDFADDDDDSDGDTGSCFVLCEEVDEFTSWGCIFPMDQTIDCEQFAEEMCQFDVVRIELYDLSFGCLDCDNSCAPDWYPED